jgi:hypothetical protein
MQVSEWRIRIARDPPMQQSSHAGDDVIEASGSQTVIPAQAGIQWRYLTDWDYPSPHLCET